MVSVDVKPHISFHRLFRKWPGEWRVESSDATEFVGRSHDSFVVQLLLAVCCLSWLVGYLFDLYFGWLCNKTIRRRRATRQQTDGGGGRGEHTFFKVRHVRMIPERRRV